MTDEDIRAIFKSTHTADRYFSFEKTLRSAKLGDLVRIDIVVFFCKYYLKCGRRKMIKRTTLTDYQVRQSYKKLKVPDSALSQVENIGQI